MGVPRPGCEARRALRARELPTGRRRALSGETGSSGRRGPPAGTVSQTAPAPPVSDTWPGGRQGLPRPAERGLRGQRGAAACTPGLWPLGPLRRWVPAGVLGVGTQTHPARAQNPAHSRGSPVRGGWRALGVSPSLGRVGGEQGSVSRLHSLGRPAGGVSVGSPRSCGGPGGGALGSLRAAAARPRSGGACRSGSTPCCSTSGRRGSP